MRSNDRSHNHRSRRRGRGNYPGEAPPAFPLPPPPPPPPPFPSTQQQQQQLPLPPPPPPPMLDQSRYIKPRQVPIKSLPFVYDPYGGLPRREDLDPYNTSQPPPRPPHPSGMESSASTMTFRDVVLSMQSWGAHWPEPTETSIKRWARRALRAEAPILARRDKRTLHPPPAASSSATAREEPPRERKAVAEEGKEKQVPGEKKERDEANVKGSPRSDAQKPQQLPP